MVNEFPRAELSAAPLCKFLGRAVGSAVKQKWPRAEQERDKAHSSGAVQPLVSLLFVVVQKKPRLWV